MVKKGKINRKRKIVQRTSLTSGVRRLESVSYKMLKKALEEGDVERAKKILIKAHALKAPRLEQLQRIVEMDAKFPVFSAIVFGELVKNKLLKKSNDSMIFIDIDHFKSVNDKFGHKRGDDVLQVFSEAAGEISKKYGGIVGRYGGEEFAMYLPMTQENAISILRKEFVKLLHKKYVQKKIPVNARRLFSAGVSSEKRTTIRVRRSKGWIRKAKDQAYGYLMNKADKQLYLAKKRGRGRIAIDGKTFDLARVV